jgi:hypothetical protein
VVVVVTLEAVRSGADHVVVVGMARSRTLPSSAQVATRVPVLSVEMRLMRAVWAGKWRSKLPRWSRTYRLPD